MKTSFVVILYSKFRNKLTFENFYQPSRGGMNRGPAIHRWTFSNDKTTMYFRKRAMYNPQKIYIYREPLIVRAHPQADAFSNNKRAMYICISAVYNLQKSHVYPHKSHIFRDPLIVRAHPQADAFSNNKAPCISA